MGSQGRPRESPTARQREAALRRRRAVALAAVLVLASASLAVLRSGDAPSAQRRGGLASVVLPDGRRVGLRTDAPRLAARVARRLPRDVEVVRAGSRVTFRLDAAGTARALVRDEDRSTVRAAYRRVAATVAAPVLKQALPNNCESAALEVLLGTVGRRVDQLRIQAALPRSGEPDPVGTGDARVWGDPDRGYVGRPEGGGVAGGFGVFPGPVIATAARFGVKLDDLSGVTPARIYERLLMGRAVMAWVGLSDGPYGSWTSPEGKPIKVNFGEHTVVLHGVRPDGTLLVSNVLQGTREVWTRAKFESWWARLGRRAVGVPV